MIKLTECPRDAMQGFHEFIPTQTKAAYINLLLQVGFDTIDFGSFVSPKAIPQLKDTPDVLKMLDDSLSKSKLLAIVANIRGIKEGIQYDVISCLGFPFSISETFQQRNTNTSIHQSLNTVEELVNLCSKHHKQPVVYLSMGFGNPYGDEWNLEIVGTWTQKLVQTGIKNIMIADTAGVSVPETIKAVFRLLTKQYPKIEFGVHLHSTPASWQEKIEAAYQNGCKRFDAALKGYGGCPMADDKLTGNIATENVISYLQDQGQNLNLNMDKWQEAMEYSRYVF